MILFTERKFFPSFTQVDNLMYGFLWTIHLMHTYWNLARLSTSPDQLHDQRNPSGDTNRLKIASSPPIDFLRGQALISMGRHLIIIFVTFPWASLHSNSVMTAFSLNSSLHHNNHCLFAGGCGQGPNDRSAFSMKNSSFEG